MKLATRTVLGEVEIPGQGDSVRSLYSKVLLQRELSKGEFDNHVVTGLL